MASSIALQTVFADDLCSIYQLRSLLVIAWQATPTVSTLRPMTQALITVVRKTPSDFLMCAMASTEWPLPDGEARLALQTGIQRVGQVRAAVNVILGTGFRAAAMRAGLAGIAMVLRPTYPLAFVGTETEAASFLAMHWPGGDLPVPPRLELAEALATVAPRSPHSTAQKTG